MQLRPMDLPREENHGLVVGNAALSADVSPHGNLFQRILYNPPCFAPGRNELREAGRSALYIGPEETPDRDLPWTVREHTWPRYRASTLLEGGVRLDAEAFAPLSAKDPETIFLPALLLRLRFTAGDAPATVPLCFAWQEGSGYPFRESPLFARQPGLGLALCSDAFLACMWDVECVPQEAAGCLCLRADVSVPAQGSREVWFALGIFEEENRWRTRIYDIPALAAHLRASAAALSEETERFIALVPDTGDAKLREYTRWYMQAAVLLTKSTRTGEVITMGYSELNQRDSFWTSFVHMTLWPSLEREMIRVSMRWQRLDGKIPTTVLPLIEREWDIDINEYFCLRIARYYRRHRDMEFLRECFPAFAKAVAYLQWRDTDGDGLPEQVPGDYWADWKDVPGVTGRKLAPHFCLLWLAVLREGAFLARELREDALAEEWDAWYRRADEHVNLPVEQGGMWDGDHYCEVWYDGMRRGQVLIDQCVGAIWGVIPEERLGKIYQALQTGECPFGIRETYPYRGDDFGYPPGTYHNGGVWPYLMFVDALGRYRAGYAGEAERLIKATAHFDLEEDGSYAPNEYLHGETGENMGAEVQGWSAALYAAIVQGAFDIEHVGEDRLRIVVRFPNRDFDTLLVLPEGCGTLHASRRGGTLSVEQQNDERLHVEIMCP